MCLSESLDDWMMNTVAQDQEMFELYQHLDEESMAILKQQVTYKIPLLGQKRMLLSFKNGVFDIDSGTFTTDEVTDVCQNHFDFDFDETLLNIQSWIDIQTPVMDSLLNGQNFTEDEIEKMWVMLGRLFYTLRTHDHWHSILYLNDPEKQSQAKQDIISLLVYIHGEDVVQLPGTSFCTGDICDASIYIINDIDMNLSHRDRYVLISWVSSRSMELEDGTTIKKVITPGVITGAGDFELKMTTKNDEPYFNRLVKFNFTKNHDSVIEDLKKEICSIIVKANAAYRKRASVNPVNLFKAFMA
jgi:hypothetical protein